MPEKQPCINQKATAFLRNVIKPLNEPVNDSPISQRGVVINGVFMSPRQEPTESEQQSLEEKITSIQKHLN